MKGNRDVLEEVLKKKFETIKHDAKFVEQIKQLLGKKKILAGDVQRVIDQDVSISKIDDTFLFLITDAIHSITDENALNPENYFNEKEVQIASRYEEQLEERKHYPLNIENALQLTSRDFVAVMTIKELVDWYNSGLIEYNPETQRNPKERQGREGKIVKVANVNPQSVKEITEHILNKTFRADTLILNLLSDGRDQFEYDPRTGRLKIISGEIDILDGFHRLNAFVQVINNFNPDEDLKIQVAFKNYTVKEAQAYVAQINTVNKMPNTYIQKLRADRYSDVVAQVVMENSELKGRVSPTHLINSNIGHLLSYKTLTEEIDEQVSLNSKVEAMKFADYLVVFFDYLLGGKFIDEFKKEVSGKTFMSKHQMFSGYLALASQMYLNNTPARLVEDVLSTVDLSENNKELVEILDNKRAISDKKFKKAIRKYFQEVYEESGVLSEK